MWFYYWLLVAPVVQSDSLHWPFISIFNIQFQHVINLSLHPVNSEISTSRSDYYTCFCACSVMFYFNFTLSYMLTTFQYVRYIFLWCRFRFSASRSRIDQFPDLQFSRFSGESSFSEDNSHEFHSAFQSFSFSFARFSWGLSKYF